MSKVIATTLATDVAVQALSTTINGIVEYRKAAMQIQLECERIMKEFEVQISKIKKEHKQTLEGMRYAHEGYLMAQKNSQKAIKKLQKQQDVILAHAMNNPEDFTRAMEFYHQIGDRIQACNDDMAVLFREHCGNMLHGGLSHRQGRVYDMDG